MLKFLLGGRDGVGFGIDGIVVVVLVMIVYWL